MKALSICKEERILYDKIIDVLGWRVEDDNVLHHMFFPLMMNQKKLIRVTEDTKEIDETKFIEFVPLFNYKQTQYLTFGLRFQSYGDDLICDDSEEIPTPPVLPEIFTSKEGYGQNTQYRARIAKGDYTELLMTGFSTETEAILVICYNYLKPDDNIRDLIKTIRTIKTKEKAERKKMDKSKGKRKKGDKK